MRVARILVATAFLLVGGLAAPMATLAVPGTGSDPTASAIESEGLARVAQAIAAREYFASANANTAPPHPAHGPWRRFHAQVAEEGVRTVAPLPGVDGHYVTVHVRVAAPSPSRSTWWPSRQGPARTPDRAPPAVGRRSAGAYPSWSRSALASRRSRVSKPSLKEA
jgi:hypothetical protein